MSQELSVHLITILAFGAVAIGVYAIGQFLAVQIRVHQRVAAQSQDAAQRRDAEAAPGLASGFDALVSTIFDEKRFGVEGSVRTKLRRELIRAGFFRVDAINYYIFARVATVVVSAIAVLIAEEFMVNSEWYLKLGLAAVVIPPRSAWARCLHRAPHKEIAPGISDRLSRHARSPGRLYRRRA